MFDNWHLPDNWVILICRTCTLHWLSLCVRIQCTRGSAHWEYNCIRHDALYPAMNGASAYLTQVNVLCWHIEYTLYTAGSSVQGSTTLEQDTCCALVPATPCLENNGVLFSGGITLGGVSTLSFCQ